MPDTHFLIPRDLDEIPYQGNTFFFDTNVWIYLYSPVPMVGDQRVAQYSALLKRILEGGGQVAIDALVVAEFINQYLRQYYAAMARDRYPEYKDFRRSEEYVEAATNVSDELYHIEQTANRVNLDFLRLDLDAVIAQFGKLSSDFNDVVFWKICRDQGFILVSHDGDCNFEDLSVVSANKKAVT